MNNMKVAGNFTYDVSNNPLFKKNNENYINALGIDQLKRIGNVYLLDVFLSEGNCVELHYHPNATELIYCISGEAEVGFMNLDTNEWQNFIIQPGEVVSIPQGWWHYACATKNNTHILAIHDTNDLETVFGSDILKLTPNDLLAHIYCLDEEEVENTLSPIRETVVIGPPADCRREEMQGNMQTMETMERMESMQNIKNIGDMERISEMTKVGSMPNTASMESMPNTTSMKNKLKSLRTPPMEVRGVTEVKKPMELNMERQVGIEESEGMMGENNYPMSYRQMQPFFDLDNHQAIQPFGGYYYMHPMNVCHACLGFF